MYNYNINMVELTKKQINKLMKGGAIQLSSSHLKGMDEDFLNGLEDKTIKKMVRALKEGRGMRLKLSTREMDDMGGKLSGTNKKIVKGLKSVGKVVARPAIMGLTDALVTGALTMSGNPQLAPFVVPMAQAGVEKGLDKAKLGFGVGKDEIKRIKKQMIEHLKPHLEQKKHILPLVNKIFKHGTDILDMDEIPIKGGKITLKKVGKHTKKVAKEIFKATKPILKELANQAIEQGLPMLEEGLQQAGVDPASSSAIMGSVEKLSRRGVDKYLTSTPQEQALYDKRYEAMQNPQLTLNNYGNKTLDSLQNRTSQYIEKYVPQEYAPQMQQQLQDYRNTANQQMENITSSNPFNEPVRRRKGGRIGLVRKIYSNDDIIPVRGGMMIQSHMSNLLDYTNPAMRPFIYPPNQPQGFKSGGSFRGYGSYDRLRSKYGGSFM
jgi:hypothetical protein